MSGPLGTEATGSSGRAEPSPFPVLEIVDSRSTQVGAFPICRALPQRLRRTVGAWCFADHAGPVDLVGETGPDIGPHPHMGLQTVTWLVAGELVHHDSLGSEQPIRPGQLNLMTAGRGIAHSEEGTNAYRGQFHGIQLWVAQPESTRTGEPSFEHHAELPRTTLEGATATVIVGGFDGVTSPARRDSDHFGVELDLQGPRTVMPLRSVDEHALIVLSGAIELEGRVLVPGHLVYLGSGRDECVLAVRSPTRAMLLGGIPFAEPILMWWNFVGRTHHEMEEAYEHWSTDDGWFGHVRSRLARIPVSPPSWLREH